MIESTNEECTTTQMIYRQLGISDQVYRFSEKILAQLRPRFDEIDQNAEYNQLKVLKAMQDMTTEKRQVCIQTYLSFKVQHP